MSFGVLMHAFVLALEPRRQRTRGIVPGRGDSCPGVPCLQRGILQPLNENVSRANATSERLDDKRARVLLVHAAIARSTMRKIDAAVLVRLRTAFASDRL